LGWFLPLILHWLYLPLGKWKSCFVVLWSSSFGDIIYSSENLVLWSCGPLHLEIKCASVQILFCGPVVLSIGRYNKLKCKYFLCGTVVLSIWRYNMLKYKSCFVVLWSSPFWDLICSRANIFLWSCGPLNLEIKYAQCKSCFVVPESSAFGVIIS
jgi:hypothetical protein